MAAARLHGPSIRRRFASRAGVLLAMAAAHPFSLLVTLVLLYAAWIVGERIVSWGIIHATFIADDRSGCNPGGACWAFVVNRLRSEEHTSEPQSLMRISYAALCLNKKKNKTPRTI